MKCGVRGEHLVYIGSSKNIRKRVLSSHHLYRRLLNRGLFAYTRHIVTEDYISLERQLIRERKPLLNIHHNG